MATSTTNIVSSLNAGSGVDIKALAQSLVDAEKAPQADLIQKRIDKSNAKISGYGAVSFALDTLKSAFDGLRDVSDYASVSAGNSQPSAFGVTPSATASTGTYDIEVDHVATAQRSVIGAASLNGEAIGFASSSDVLNGGASFTLNLSVNGGADQVITVTTATPAGMVSAINSADLGIEAQLINTGADGYKIVVTGETGAEQAFTLAPPATIAGAAFDADDLQAAGDAQFSVNGLSLTRSSNSVSDAIDGVTLDLYTATTGTARVDLSRDAGSIKTNVQTLVTAYNDFADTLDVLGNRDSEVELYGGALAGDSFLVSLRSQIRAMITDTSDSAGDNITAFRDIGISFDRYGNMTFDEGTFDDAIANHYDEVVTMMTADTEAQSVYSTAPAGVAGAAYKSIDEMLRSTGTIASRSRSAESEVSRYEERMSDLEDRMGRLLERYLKQFSVMDSIVGTLNSTRTGLTSTFEGMMATYTK
jgi:flagellar hook-associated protein 2